MYQDCNLMKSHFFALYFKNDLEEIFQATIYKLRVVKILPPYYPFPSKYAKSEVCYFKILVLCWGYIGLKHKSMHSKNSCF